MIIISFIKKVYRVLANPRQYMEGYVKSKRNEWDDEKFLKALYRVTFGRKLHLDNPRSFNEKLNWMKLNVHNPLYTNMADKYKAKEIAASLIGLEHIVPCYGAWEKFDDIDWDSLPEQFVLKCTHDSSGVILCRDKKKLDKEAARKKIERCLGRNYYSYACEWVYKDIKPLIIADKLLDDHSGTELRDYKFWCFNGEPKYMYFSNKGKNIIENFYDMDFNPVYINHGFERRIPEFEKPVAFEEMKRYAAKLSKDIPFVRVDFFYVDGVVYFAEWTFYDWGGLRPFADYQQDLDLGKLLVLPKI